MDNFGTRAAHLQVLDLCLDEVHKSAKSANNGQTSLFGEEETFRPVFRVPEVEEMALEHLLVFEKDLLGFYLHEPPYLKLLKMIDQFVNLKISEITEQDVNDKVTVGGVVLEVKKVITKKSGAEMAFVRVFDGIKSLDCVVFPKTYELFKGLLEKEQVLLLDGKLERREEDYSLLVDQIQLFDPETSLAINQTSVEIEMPLNPDPEVFKKINVALRQYPGASPISILIPSGEKFKKMPLKFTVDPSFELVQNVEEILGPNSIKLI
jgi:DNA polymerase-3 subunit alpha